MDLIATYHLTVKKFEYKLKHKVFEFKQSTPLSSTPGALGPGQIPVGCRKSLKVRNTFEKKITGIIGTGSPTCPFNTLHQHAKSKADLKKLFRVRVVVVRVRVRVKVKVTHLWPWRDYIVMS